MGLVVGGVILSLLVLAILTLPWWWPGQGRGLPAISGEDLTAELNDDVATGVLAAKDLEPAARDLEATAEKDTQGEQRFGPQHRWSRGLLVLLLVPLVAGGLYLHFGNWRAAIQGVRAATIHLANGELAQLHEQARRHPADSQAWINLAQGAEALGKYDLAAHAYARAVKLEAQPDADLLGAWGGAQILANPQEITDQEQQIFSRVLELDPDNARGLWYGGLIALKSGKQAQAISDWRRLLKQPGVPPQVAQLIRDHLQSMGAAVPATRSAAAPKTPDAMASAAATRVSVTIMLAPKFHSSVQPGETLFVFIRSAGGGPPLAVRKITVQKFPVTVVLSDADAMLNGHDLSSAKGPLESVAMISLEGTTEMHAGDLLGAHVLQLKHGEKQAVTVLIDHRANANGS